MHFYRDLDGKMMNIMYLTWGETPRVTGVFNSQAIGQVLANSRAMPQSKFTFVSAIPLLHSGLVKEGFNYTREIDAIRDRLAQVPFFWLPIFAPQNFVFSTKNTFRLMHIGTGGLLKRLIKKIKPDIVHCRSYHAAYAALIAKRRFGFTYKVIFDPRGIWSEEVALRRGFSEDTRNYTFLKSLELWIVRSSDALVSVSPEMEKYFSELAEIYSTPIYLSAPVEKLKPITSSDTIVEDDGRISVVYVGTLDAKTWHRPSALLSLYQHLSEISRDIRLTIVSMSNPGPIKRIFIEAGFKDIRILSVSSVEDLADILHSQNFGILSYFNPKNRGEELLSSVVMAVKTAEYLAAGLPILVNKYCGGAADIVTKHNVGISYSPESFEEINAHSLHALMNSETSRRAVELAQDLFDYDSNARKYGDLYNIVYLNQATLQKYVSIF